MFDGNPVIASYMDTPEQPKQQIVLETEADPGLLQHPRWSAL